MKAKTAFAHRVADPPGNPLLQLKPTKKAVLSLLFLLCMLWSYAADFPVTNTNDSGPGSLRQAILDVNAAGSGPHNIRFAVYGQITILTSLPIITQTVTIDGENKITINANGINQLINPFDIRANNVVVRNFRLTNSGDINITIRNNTTGVLIENIYSSSTTGNLLNSLVYVDGSSTNLTLRNLTCTDIEPAASTYYGRAINITGGLQTGLVMDNIHLSSQGNARGGEAIVFRDASVNGWTLTNSTISGFLNGIVLDNTAGVIETANNIELNNVTIDSLYSGVALGFYSDFVNTDIRFKNCSFDLNVVTTGDDGDYTIRFDNTTDGVTMDNVKLKDGDIYTIWFNGAAKNINLNRLDMSIPSPGLATSGQFIRFEGTANTVSITNSVLDGDKQGTTDDSDFGIVFIGATDGVTLDNIKVNEFDVDGIYLTGATSNFQMTNSEFTKNYDGIEFYNNVARTNVDIINSSFKNQTRSGILVNATNAVSDVDLTGDTVINNGNHGIWFYGGTSVTDAQVTGGVIRNNAGAGIFSDAPGKIVITNNSIYNNTSPGISFTGGNCGYTAAAGRTPVLVSSTNLGGGQYQLQLNIPNITAGAQYTVDIYANDAATSKTSGQYFVTSLSGLSAGVSTHTITYNSGPGATGVGFWTGTLRIAANNCGTSEFGNSIPLGVKAPACITNGIVGWYRADMGVNGYIWGDISGNANHMNVIGDPDTAASYVNFNKAFYYDGNDAHQMPAAAGVTGAYTIMGLGRLEGTQNSRVFSSSTGNKLMGWWGANENGYHNEGWLKTTTAITNLTKLYSVKRANTGSGPYEFKGNGVLLSAGTASNGTVWTLDVGAAVYGEYSKVYVPEVFVFNRDLNTTEIQRLESYMAIKYGITLNNGLTDYVASDGTTLIWTADSNAGYTRRITGIGKDDCTMMHQKQSLSADTGIVTMALGSAIMLSNEANTNAITTDKTFFVFADDNGSLRLTTAVTGTNVNQRMGRVWKVQKSATWANQNITFRVKGTGKNNYLLISSDAGFATISQELQLDENGQVTFNSSLIANGAYFTIASTIQGPANVNNGVALWLRADDGTATGSTWNDVSGNANGAVQTVTDKQATVLPSIINFNPALKFDGINDHIVSPSLFTGTGVNNAQIYAVTITDLIQNQSVFGEVVGNAQHIHAHLPYSNSIMYFDAPTGYRAEGAWGGTVGTPYLWSFLRSPSTMSGNRNRITVGSFTGAMSNIPGANSPFNVGSANGGGGPFGGKIAELIVYNNSAATSATQRQQIESYLAIKYGITLSPGTAVDYLASDGSKFWDATLNSGYNRNITGVGRDNASSLLQKQSVSTDDKYLTIAIGSSVATSNAANASAIANNLSFFVTGDNNAAKMYTTSVAGIPGANIALARIWKVQKINWTDQNITLKVDSTTTAPQYLLISTDATFGAGDLALPVTNGAITLSTSQLANGSYFTFANSLKGPGGVTTGIGAWYRGDSGLKPSVWNDFSGNGYNIPQPLVANQPTVLANGINFNPTANFSGPQFFGLGNLVDPATSIFGAAIPQNVAVFGVSTAAAGANGGAIFDQYATNGYAVAAAPTFSNNMTYWDAPYGFRVNAAFAGPLDKQMVWSFTKTATNMSVFRDRSTVVNTNGSYLLTGITGGNYASNLGVWHGNGYFTGKIPEVIVYRDITALTATDRLKIESYLALKYGVTLDLTGSAGYTATDASVYFNTAANAGYLKHITGIGRDNLTELHQKQSVSADTGLVTISLGNTVAVSNAVNAETVTTDKSFFLISDDGNATAYVTSVSGLSGITNRMTRIFKVNKTGNWTDQNIIFKVRGGNAQTVMLVSTDAVFGAGDTKVAMNADSTITISSADLANGVYFTFARNIKGPNGVNAGLNFWLRADDNNTTGSSWKDYAGYGHEAIQGVTTLQPITDARAINFNYGLKLDGIDDYLDINTTRVHPDNASIFVAATGTGFASVRDLIGAGAVGSSVGMEFRITSPSSINYLENNSSVLGVGGTAPWVENRPYLWSVTQNNGTNGVKLYQNFKLDNQGTVNLSPQMANLVSIGSRTIASRAFFWQGNISEVIVYDRVLTDAERQSVESYLALKYGITLNQTPGTNYLASDGSVYWSSTTNGVYNKRITGIGRDDSTTLYTKQSLSADTGFVTLALGTGVALTNESNSATIGNDRSFFVFADNGQAANNFTTTVTGSGNNVTRRLPRVWKVQKTNWTDQNITLKVTPLGVDNYLLISTDENFATINQELPVAADGTVTLSSSLLANGIYFTFGAPLKSPGGVSGHAIWLRADVGTSSTVNNSLVGQWNDLSAFSNLMVQPTPTLQPTYLNNTVNNINFNPVMRFGGANYIMNGQSILKTGTYTGAAAFAVNSQATALNAIIFTEPAASSTYFNLHATWGDNGVYWDPPYPASRLTYNAGNINNQVNLWTGLNDNSLATNKQQILRNGTSVATGNVNASIVGNNSPFSIASGYNGRLPELIVYTTPLTVAQQQRVNTYLSVKYGITLNNGNTSYIATNGTTTVWDATVNATHKNNIAGIGRDDEEILNQKQSRSINAGTQVTIGFGSIDSTNSANTNTFTNDLSYLVWGDDNAGLNFRTAVTGSSLVNYRMARTWKVQETGTIGNVLIAIPANALANPQAAYIIVSNDATFDGTDAFTKLDPITIGNVLHYAASVDLSNGAYFTFANDLKIPGGVAGNTLWLRADYGTSSTVDGTTISDWNDFGADINNAVQATAASQPAFADNATSNINFNPVVKFNGTSQRMILDGTRLPVGTTGRTVIASTANAAIASRTLISWGDPNPNGTGTRYAMELGGGVRALEVSNSRYGNAATNTLLPGITMYTNATGSTNANTQMRLNGAGITNSFIAVGNQTLNTANLPTAYIGDNAMGGFYYSGSLGDVVVYDRTLTATEQQRVETYMALKYGVTLSQTVATDYLATDGSSIWNATANATYKNSITGIGRDDLEGLTQKQSRNMDSTRLRIAIGLGALTETNTVNANSFTADKSYMIWGDDNGAVSFKTVVTSNPIVNYCMTRIWKVQETGTVGDVEVAIPYDALPNPRQSYLAVSNDETFDNADTYIPLYDITLNGKKHWAAKVNFNTNQYFTIAAFIKSPGGVGATNLWMRADQGIQNNTDGTPVDMWIDYGNEVNNANQATAALQPVFHNNATANVNYNPVVTFNGTSQQMNLDVTKLPVGTSPRTVIGVGMSSVAPVTTRYIMSWGTAGTSLGAGLAAAGAQAGYYVGYGNDLVTANNFWLPNVTNEMFGTWAGSGGVANLYSKMLPVATPANKAWNTGAVAARIGNSIWGNEYWSGPITEVIMFDRVLTDVERQRVSTYLAIRNGYTMDQTTPYRDYLSTAGTVVWNGTANATHNLNIAGIGRDDIEGLNQKQSKSNNAGAILAAGLGNIASDNPANSSTFSSDASYMIWGSNSAALTTSTTDLPAMFSQRLTQEWKTSLSNFNNQIQPVAMEFDLTGITHNGKNVSDFTLLIDNDGDGNFTTGTITQVPASGYAGNKLSFANVTALSNNAVFTVAFGPQSLRLNAKAILQGAWNGTTMSTGLKTAAVLPDTDPYNLNTTPSVTPNAAAAQVVDWILVELRDAANPAAVVDSRAALLLSNGNIVDTGYAQPLSFYNAPAGNYNVVIRHRNHLGVMTLNAVDFSTGTGTVDFTQSATATFGTYAQKNLGSGVMGLWAGDVNGDRSIRHSAAPSDATPVANAVLNHAGNTTVSPAYTGFINVYSLFDLNLDGRIYYTATPSDHAIIISNVKTHPGNSFGLTSYIIKEQLP